MKTANIQLEHNEFQRKPIKLPLCILANDIDVPMNIGSIFRIADALGVQKIFLTGSSSVPPNRKIKKTSRSTEKSVEYEYKENALEVVEQLKQSGYLIVSLEITASSIDIMEFTAKKVDKMCLIVGAENAGVSQDLLDISDHTIHIPMFGQNSSMNVATACAIATFEFARKFMP